MALHVGFAGYFSLRLCNDPARAEVVASLLVDPRWPWPPHSALFYRLGVVAKHERARKVTGKKGKVVLRDGIVDPAMRELELRRSSVDAENDATAFLHTGQRIHADWYEQPFTTYGRTRGNDLPDGTSIDAWVELVHELMVALDVAHAVVPVWPTMPMLVSDLGFLTIVLDTRWAQIDLGPPPDFALQQLRGEAVSRLHRSGVNGMNLYMGFAGYFQLALFEHPARAEKVASLVVEPRWPWPPISGSFGVGDKIRDRTRRQRYSKQKGRDALRDGILDPDHRDLRLSYHADAEQNHGSMDIETGQRPIADHWPCPFTITGHTKADELREGADLLGWVELMHELMATLDVGNAVLPVWPTWYPVLSDTTFTRIMLDTPKGEYLMGVRGEFERQRARANYWRPQLGAEYIRHPRWGTYLRRAHLDRVGGLDRIRETVKLAKIVELGDLVFLQCTEHPAGALTPEGERVRRTLEEVLAPIIVPAWPGEQPEIT